MQDIKLVLVFSRNKNAKQMK